MKQSATTIHDAVTVSARAQIFAPTFDTVPNGRR